MIAMYFLKWLRFHKTLLKRGCESPRCCKVINDMLENDSIEGIGGGKGAHEKYHWGEGTVTETE